MGPWRPQWPPQREARGVLGTREARDPEETGAWEGLLGKLGLDGSWRIFTDGKREWEGKGDPGVRNSGSGRSREPGAGTSLAHFVRVHGGHS